MTSLYSLPLIERLRLLHAYLPRIEGTRRAKRRLDILITDGAVDAPQALQLASHLQILKWYFGEVQGAEDLRIGLHVPATNAKVTAALEGGGIDYVIFPPVDGTLADAVVQHDIDVVLAADGQLAEVGELALVTNSVDGALEAAEIFSRGFDVPWSDEFRIKDVTWTGFYVAWEGSTFHPLIDVAQRLNGRSESGDEALRVLVHNSLPNLCFARDELAFYEMQKRAARRSRTERQRFAFEYGYHLNHFYLGLYAAIDQLAIVVSYVVGLGIDDADIGATYRLFRERLQANSPGMFALFDDPAFGELIRRVKLLRHQAAHRAPLNLTTVYRGDDFTTDELNAKAREMGLVDGLDAMPAEIRDSALELARVKARVALMEVAADDVVIVNARDGRYIVSPDPAGDFARFLALLTRVLSALLTQA